MEWQRHAVVGRLAIAAAAVAAVLGLWHGLSLHPDVVDRLRDDAFYEFTWAANLAAGRGPMVSDGTTTSGVQLLWSLVLVPIAWLFSPAALPVVAPWLGLLLHVSTAVLLAFSSRDRTAACCVGLCWLGNPLLVRECQNGQETALACLLLVVLWLQRGARERRFLVFALLATLARTDLFAIAALLSLWRHKDRPWRALGTPLCVLAVLLLTNRLLGGGWLPDSGAPMAWLWHANFAATEPDLRAFFAQAWWYLRPALLGGPYAIASAMGMGIAVFSIVRPWWPRSLRALPALSVGIAAACGVHDLAAAGWAALLLALLPVDHRHGVPRALLALVVGGAAIVVLHWAVRWYPRDYYAAPLVVVATAAVLRLGHVRLLLLVFALAQIVDLPRVQPEPLHGQQEMQMGGMCLADVLPAGERVGCFNSGLVTFHASVLAAGTARQRAVVGLDGVVDARALLALQQRALSAWLDELHIRFVLDNPVQFANDPRLPHACGRWFGDGFLAERDLVEVARFDVPGVDNGRPGGDSFRLYWRRGRGEPPPVPLQARDLGGEWHGGRVVLWPAQQGQQLDIETAPGAFLPLVTADVATTVIVHVPANALGTGRLFVRGDSSPVLTLRPL